MTGVGRIGDDQRGISSQLSAVLTLGITTVLVAGLIIGVTTGVERQERQSVEQQLSTIGERIATEITGVDRLVYTSPNATISLETTHAMRISGSQYTVRVVDDPSTCQRDACLEMGTRSPSTTVSVPFSTEAPVEPTTVAGGPLVVTYNQTARTIAIEER